MYILENQQNLAIRLLLGPDRSLVYLKYKLHATIPLVNSPCMGFVLAPAQQADVQTCVLCSASIGFVAHLTSASNICTMFCGITDVKSKKRRKCISVWFILHTGKGIEMKTNLFLLIKNRRKTPCPELGEAAELAHHTSTSLSSLPVLRGVVEAAQITCV